MLPSSCSTTAGNWKKVRQVLKNLLYCHAAINPITASVVQHKSSQVNKKTPHFSTFKMLPPTFAKDK
jgi:hypothetical protein